MELFGLPTKIVAGSLTTNDKPAANADYAQNTLVGYNNFEITTADIMNDTLPPFGLLEQDSDYSSAQPVAGVFGPAAATNTYSYSLYNIVANGNTAANYEQIPTIAYNYTLTSFPNTGVNCNYTSTDNPTIGCKQGGYPYRGDIFTSPSGSPVPPHIQLIENSSNLLSTTPIPTFFPTGF